jgi:MFS family permease
MVMTSTAERARVRGASVLSPEYRGITVSSMTLVILAAFDGMAIAAALPRIGADLGVSLLPWVLTAFSLTSIIGMLAAGPLIDSLGVQRMYRLTLLVFFVSSAVCAVAPSLLLLVIARGVQGIGGGLVMAVTLANIGVSYPPEIRSRAFAVSTSVWGIMGLVGPGLVAFMLSVVSWRSLFVLNLPLVAFAGIIGWRRFPDSGDAKALQFDVRGLLMLSAFTLTLLLSLSQLDRRSFVGLIVAAALAAAYWRHSRVATDPILARRHFISWPFGALNLIPFTFFAGSLALDAYLPIYVQGALGRSSSVAAFAVAFLAIGWTMGGFIASHGLNRVHNTTLMVLGFAFVLPPLIAGVVLYTAHASVVVVFAMSLLQGIGIGTVTNSTVSLLQRSADASEMGRASSAHQFMRHLGFTLGAASAGAILLGVVAAKVGSVEPLRRLLDKQSTPVSDATRSAIADGVRGISLMASLMTAAGLAVAIIVHRRFARSPTVDVA